MSPTFYAFSLHNEVITVFTLKCVHVQSKPLGATTEEAAGRMSSSVSKPEMINLVKHQSSPRWSHYFILIT